jgi:deazaflavin-dependent oxidoreductase (nitroreductase family)
MTTPPRTRLRWIRPFTTHVFNRFSRLFAGRLPGFAILINKGRRSGKTYETPINVFRHGDHYVFALTYGSDVQWLKNVLAAGRVTMISRGRRIELVEPELIVDPTRKLVPAPVRIMLRFDRVTEFLRMRAASPAGVPGRSGASPAG